MNRPQILKACITVQSVFLSGIVVSIFKNYEGFVKYAIYLACVLVCAALIPTFPLVLGTVTTILDSEQDQLTVEKSSLLIQLWILYTSESSACVIMAKSTSNPLLSDIFKLFAWCGLLLSSFYLGYVGYKYKSNKDRLAAGIQV